MVILKYNAKFLILGGILDIAGEHWKELQMGCSFSATVKFQVLVG